MDVGRGSFRVPGVSQQKPVAQPVAAASGGSEHHSAKQPKSGKKKLLVIAGVVLAALLVFTAVWAVFVAPKGDAQKVKSDQYQAVFLGDGQVYFGKISNFSDTSVTVKDVFYLNVGTATTADASSNVSLVKLGCELHGPEDEMVINRATMTFWENLKDSSQVSTAITNWKKSNPDGQKCESENTANSATQADPAATPQQSGTQQP